MKRILANPHQDRWQSFLRLNGLFFEFLLLNVCYQVQSGGFIEHSNNH